jgi:hypothetical protein
MTGVVLALLKVRPQACCLEGIIESSNLAKKSMPRIGQRPPVKNQIRRFGQKNRVRVAEGRGVPRQQADGGDQQKREFRQRPVELRERLRDFGGGEHRVDAVEP